MIHRALRSVSNDVHLKERCRGAGDLPVKSCISALVRGEERRGEETRGEERQCKEFSPTASYYIVRTVGWLGQQLIQKEEERGGAPG